MKSTIICPPETKCKDCDIQSCPKNLYHPWIATRGNGKPKLTLINLIQESNISQSQKDELIEMVKSLQ